MHLVWEIRMKCYFSRNLWAGGCQPREGGEEKASQTGGIVTRTYCVLRSGEQGAFIREMGGQRGWSMVGWGEACRCIPGLRQGLEPAVEEAMAPHSNTLAWKIPWTEEPGGLPSTGLHRVGLWSDSAAAAAAVEPADPWGQPSAVWTVFQSNQKPYKSFTESNQKKRDSN